MLNFKTYHKVYHIGITLSPEEKDMLMIYLCDGKLNQILIINCFHLEKLKIIEMTDITHYVDYYFSISLEIFNKIKKDYQKSIRFDTSLKKFLFLYNLEEWMI